MAANVDNIVRYWSAYDWYASSVIGSRCQARRPNPLRYASNASAGHMVAYMLTFIYCQTSNKNRTKYLNFSSRLAVFFAQSILHGVHRVNFIIFANGLKQLWRALSRIPQPIMPCIRCLTVISLISLRTNDICCYFIGIKYRTYKICFIDIENIFPICKM